ncbi:MAG: hypothetical protein NTZ05_08905 [Chloroflexi bacterium]|nr:hypothetical protein [Chloroflexota bacterium]
MVMISSRFLAVLLIAVVVVSLAGSMLGYAIGARGQRQGLAETLAAFRPAPAANARPEPAAQPEPTAIPEPAPSNNSPAVAPARPAGLPRVADSPALTDLPLGSPAAKGGVAVTMTDAQAGKWEEGIEVRLHVTNTSGHDLHFLFVPERTVHLQDSRGANLNLRWAEYEGEMTLPDGQRRSLLRAFFQGEMRNPNVQHLTLVADELPTVGAASWRIPAPSPLTP